MRISHLTLLFVLAASIPVDVEAQSGTGRIPVKVIGGHLLVRCEISSATRRAPAYLDVRFENPAALELHGRFAGGLEISNGDTVVAIFPGFELRGLDVQAIGREKARQLERFTTRMAVELGEVACVGTIGLQAFAGHHVVLDVGAGEMRLELPREDAQPWPEDPDGEYAPIDRHGGLIWLPGRLGSGSPARVLVATGSYDTIIDADLAKTNGHPAGDVGPLLVNRVDLAPHVWFRPGTIERFHPEEPALATGLNLLEGMRVELDLVNRRARLIARAPRPRVDADLAYFRAVASGSADDVEAWIEQYPRERLAEEAARYLVDRRLETALEDDGAVRRAVEHAHAVAPEDAKASTMREYMAVFEEKGLTDLVLFAGDCGLRTARKDRDAQAAHRIHARLGEILLDRGEVDPAWKHLLSAAFGMPTDGLINLSLGRVYESKGKFARAFSRYVQAMITEDGASGGLDGVRRTHAKLGGGDSMSISTIEKLIEGKVPALRSASRLKPKKGDPTTRNVLIELFTGAQCPPCVAADLAVDAAMSWAPDGRIAVIEYHLPIPAAEPLISPIAFATAENYGVDSTPQLFIDGRQGPALGGREEQKNEKFDTLRGALEERLRVDAPHRLEIRATSKDGIIEGAVVVKGPDRPGLRVHAVLCEKGVLYPGRNKIVVHHAVARAALLGGADGVTIRPGSDDSPAEASFRIALVDVRDELHQLLDDVEARSGASFDMRPVMPDARALTIVAYLRDASSGEVLQSTELDVSIGGGS